MNTKTTLGNDDSLDMSDWGKIKLVVIDAYDFWALYDEMIDDKSGFVHNRGIILKAFKENRMYGLRVQETDEMYKRRARSDRSFARNFMGELSWYLLPCFCVLDNSNQIDIIWTHSRARGNGFGSKMVKELEITSVSDILPESEEFWKKCGVKINNILEA